MIQDSTKSSRNKFGHGIESIIDLIFCNALNKSSNAKSAMLPYTNHNIVCITKYMCCCWGLVYIEDDLASAVDCFTKLFIDVFEHHANVYSKPNNHPALTNNKEAIS